MAKFLDLTGLTRYTTKIKEWANNTFVPKTRKINGKALSADVTLSATDVGAIPTAQKGTANGVAELDESGKVLSSQLPSYVDDVIEGYLNNGKFYKDSGFQTEIPAESGKIYANISTNRIYRWGGSQYYELSPGVALGETSSTAYRGDRGKIAYDHSQEAHARADATKTEKSTTNGNIKINDAETVVYTHPTHSAKSAGLYKVTVDESGHVTAATAVAKSDITALGIPAQDTKYSNFKGAAASTAGAAGLVPAPASGDTNKYLKSDGTWATISVPTVESITTGEIDALFQ